MTYEESFAKLEEIKAKLENPETKFDEALKLYELMKKWSINVSIDNNGKVIKNS